MKIGAVAPISLLHEISYQIIDKAHERNDKNPYQ